MANEKYADMLRLPHHQSVRHAQMSLLNRAAQFAPFAALTGYDEAVEETARLTEKAVNLDGDAVVELDRRLRLIAETLPARHCVTVTYFLPDPHKDGGRYVSETGVVRRLDRAACTLLMENGVVIPVDDILALEGTAFETTESV